MAIKKNTLFFECVDTGWTESYYTNDGNPLDVSITRLRSLALLRAQILSTDARITFLRVSTVGVNPRETLTRNAALSSSGGTTYIRGTQRGVADKINTSLMLRVRNAPNTKFKFIYTRGQPDVMVDDDGSYVPTAAFNNNMQSFVGQLAVLNFGWYSVNTKITTAINAIVVQANGQVSFTTLANAFDPSQVGKIVQIRIKGVTGAFNLNGSVTVLVQSLTAAQTTRRIGINPWTGGGSIISNLKIVENIAAGEVERVVERKPGRPSFFSRGRSRNRVLG